jgi:hypothetical protein
MDKLPQYFPVFDRHLGKFRNTAVNVLEIGVHYGRSLRMWKDFFGPDACIAGLDINPNCVQFDDPGYVKVYTGDQSDVECLARICAEAGPFDVVIDDGGHRSGAIRTSFDFLYPQLGRHGVYIVEDTHTQYGDFSCVQANGEIGLVVQDGPSFLTTAKEMTDALNVRYIQDKVTFPRDFVQNTRSIHFYESMVVFERGRSPVYKTWTGADRRAESLEARVQEQQFSDTQPQEP